MGKGATAAGGAGRRDALKKTAALGAAVAAPLAFPAILRAQADVIRIGHLTPRPGWLGRGGADGVGGGAMAVGGLCASGG